MQKLSGINIRYFFLIDNFYPSNYENYDCAIVLQSRNNFKMNYLWNGLYYFDFNKMKKINLLNWNCLTNCDTGAMTFQWLISKTKNKSMRSLLKKHIHDIRDRQNTIKTINKLKSQLKN